MLDQLLVLELHRLHLRLLGRQLRFMLLLSELRLL